MAWAYLGQTCWLQPLTQTMVTDDTGDTTLGKL
jgi:hypothetical protein